MSEELKTEENKAYNAWQIVAHNAMRAAAEAEIAPNPEACDAWKALAVAAFAEMKVYEELEALAIMLKSGERRHKASLAWREALRNGKNWEDRQQAVKEALEAYDAEKGTEDERRTEG